MREVLFHRFCREYFKSENCNELGELKISEVMKIIEKMDEFPYRDFYPHLADWIELISDNVRASLNIKTKKPIYKKIIVALTPEI